MMYWSGLLMSLRAHLDVRLIERLSHRPPDPAVIDTWQTLAIKQVHGCEKMHPSLSEKRVSSWTNCPGQVDGRAVGGVTIKRNRL